MDEKLQKLFSEQVGSVRIDGLVSADKLKLFLVGERESDGDLPLWTDVVHLLTEHIKIQFMNEPVLTDFLRKLENERTVGPLRVAIGVRPQSGHPGQLLLRVKPFTGVPTVSYTENEIANLTNLHLFDNVETGEMVGRIIPPSAGTYGTDVFGDPIIPPAGEAILFHHDGSLDLVASQPKGTKDIFTRASGFVAHEQGYYTVRSAFVVPEDLDFRFGSLDVLGRVFVGQDVMPGFSIKAREGISVLGSVRGGSLISSEGDINVGGYAYGGPGSKILAGGSLSAGALQEVDTEILGDIFVEREVLNSTLRSAGTIRIGSGALVGGVTMATRGVQAPQIGSDAGTKTIIHLCKDIEASMGYTRLLVDLELQDQEIERLSKFLGPLAREPERIGTLDMSMREKYRLQHQKYCAACDARDKLREQQRFMIQGASECKALQVSFREKLHAGVEIIVGDCKHITTVTHNGPATLEFRYPERKFYFKDYVDLSEKD